MIICKGGKIIICKYVVQSVIYYMTFLSNLMYLFNVNYPVLGIMITKCYCTRFHYHLLTILFL